MRLEVRLQPGGGTFARAFRDSVDQAVQIVL
jgi:hypothetical protein